jgi:hypothetical protein
MPTESRVQRWRENKREQGLKHVSVWLTPEEELRLKDLAMQWHCSPSAVMQQALAQVQRAPQGEHGSPTDALRIRTLILAELAALGITLPGTIGNATVGSSVGPTDTLPQTHPREDTESQQYQAEPGNSLVTEPAQVRKSGRRRSELGTRILVVLQEHPEGLSAEELRVHAKATRPLGDMLQGMKKTGVVITQGQGRGLRYFARS